MANVFLLTKAITGIEFGTDGRALLSTLPVNAQLRLTGQSSLPGFVDVVYGQKLYGIFMVDLKSRSATIRSKAVAA